MHPVLIAFESKKEKSIHALLFIAHLILSSEHLGRLNEASDNILGTESYRHKFKIESNEGNKKSNLEDSR